MPRNSQEKNWYLLKCMASAPGHEWEEHSWQLVTLRKDLCKYATSVFSEPPIVHSGEARQSGAVWVASLASPSLPSWLPVQETFLRNLILLILISKDPHPSSLKEETRQDAEETVWLVKCILLPSTHTRAIMVVQVFNPSAGWAAGDRRIPGAC